MNTKVTNTTVQRIRELIREADDLEAECIVIPCTNLSADLIVEEMEPELGESIFDSIIVTLWKSLSWLAWRARFYK